MNKLTEGALAVARTRFAECERQITARKEVDYIGLPKTSLGPDQNSIERLTMYKRRLEKYILQLESQNLQSKHNIYKINGYALKPKNGVDYTLDGKTRSNFQDLYRARLREIAESLKGTWVPVSTFTRLYREIHGWPITNKAAAEYLKFICQRRRYLPKKGASIVVYGFYR